MADHRLNRRHTTGYPQGSFFVTLGLPDDDGYVGSFIASEQIDNLFESDVVNVFAVDFEDEIVCPSTRLMSRTIAEGAHDMCKFVMGTVADLHARPDIAVSGETLDRLSIGRRHKMRITRNGTQQAGDRRAFTSLGFADSLAASGQISDRKTFHCSSLTTPERRLLKSGGVF